MEVQLELDPFKTESTRSSTQFLDFLGDIGGFYQALDLTIFMVAQYFSAKFFLASIAGTIYHQKIPQPKKQDPKEPKRPPKNDDTAQNTPNILSKTKFKEDESVFSEGVKG
mmetsp:Transcript_11453/g.17248  ORF Transcript_11453/g.17248 Transcript_11453/m.17248 type:complete len:111 (+) Transcript_11453:658-990(+)